MSVYAHKYFSLNQVLAKNNVGKSFIKDTHKTQKDMVEKEVGEWFRMGVGDTCILVADSRRYMAKSSQCCKVIILQLK